MNDIKILDCTLRDGGYLNDWRFGEKNAQEIVRIMSKVHPEYVELGFMKPVSFVKEKIQFSSMDDVDRLFLPSKQKLALMVAIGDNYPIEKFPERSEHTVDLVRVVLWKRKLKEAYQYCKSLKENGYDLFVQATRTDQYDHNEFADLVGMFSELNPKAIYIVDTFGRFTTSLLMEYAQIADNNLGEGIRLGYHAHNNMQQAFANAETLMLHEWKHGLILDASVMGMGRGAGNLPIELLIKYLNENLGADYPLEPIYEVADKYIMPYYNSVGWGYSIPYMLSAKNNCNPNFVGYMKSKGLSIEEMSKVFSRMHDINQGIVFDTKICDEVIKEIKGV